MKIMSLKTKQLIHDGKRKVLYACDNNDKIILAFKDTFEDIDSSGSIFNLINEHMFNMINSCTIPNHFIRRINLKEQEVYNTSVFPFQIRITNIITKSLHALFDIEKGTVLKKPLLEFTVKQNNQMHVIEQNYLQMFDWCKTEHIKNIKEIALRVNDVLQAYFFRLQVNVAHCYLRFGIFEPQYTFDTNKSDNIILINDLTPYTFDLWCKKQNKILSFDCNLIKSLTSYMDINTNN